MNGVLLAWILSIGIFCVVALGAGWWLFKRARDRQHADWAAIVEDDPDDPTDRLRRMPP